MATMETMRGTQGGNYPCMTDQERIKLLEVKVAVLSEQVGTLASACAGFMGSGLNKPIPSGLARAIGEVADLGFNEGARTEVRRLAEHGFMMRQPKSVADLPEVIDLG
jgi:hypothetical protein